MPNARSTREIGFGFRDAACIFRTVNVVAGGDCVAESERRILRYDEPLLSGRGVFAREAGEFVLACIIGIEKFVRSRARIVANGLPASDSFAERDWNQLGGGGRNETRRRDNQAGHDTRGRGPL